MAEELNGDSRLTALQRLRYLGYNFRRNLSFCRHGFNASRFSSRRLDRTSKQASPGRVLTEAFLVNAMPEILSAKAIKVLDVGCGQGRLSDFLAQAGFGGDYVGIDIEDRFFRDPQNTSVFQRRFVLGDANDYPEDERFDMITSSSALEHIDDDVALLAKLDRLMTPDGVQVHIVPGGWALPLYLWHGWRQYTLCELEKRLDASRTHIYKMGGLASFFLHLVFITICESIFRLPLRQWLPNVYGRLADGALAVDRIIPSGAYFHAVCIHARKDG